MAGNVPINFVNWLDGQIESFAQEFSLTRKSEAFAAWSLHFLYDLEPDEAYTLTEFSSQGDADFDGYFNDKKNDQFILLRSKYARAPNEKRFGPEPCRELLSAFERLLNFGAPNLGGLSEQLTTSISGGAEPVLHCVLAGSLSVDAKAEFEQACDANRAVAIVHDLSGLYEKYISEETSDDLEGKVVTFKLTSKEFINASTGTLPAVVVNLSGESLGANMKIHRPHIVSANVRHNLGHRNRVNQSIRRTLESEAERSNFWYYNNGITILCDGYKLNTEESAIEVENPQIVNGCQTASALESLLDQIEGHSVAVLARVIKVGEAGADSKYAVKIAEATNSQSPVKIADLKSNDQRQKELQAAFKGLPDPWFYERKRGEWNALPKKVRKCFEKRRMTKENCGQRWRAVGMNEPAASVTAKDEMFDAEVYGRVFDPNRSVWLYLLAHHLWEFYNLLLSKSQAQYRESLRGNFTPQQLQSLLRAKKLWVAHASSLAYDFLTNHYGELDSQLAKGLCEEFSKAPDSFRALHTAILVATKHWLESPQRSNPDESVSSLLKSSHTKADIESKMQDYLAMYDPGFFDDKLPRIED